MKTHTSGPWNVVGPFDTPSVLDGSFAVRALEAPGAWGTCEKYKWSGSDDVRALIVRAEGR